MLNLFDKTMVESSKPKETIDLMNILRFSQSTKRAPFDIGNQFP